MKTMLSAVLFGLLAACCSGRPAETKARNDGTTGRDQLVMQPLVDGTSSRSTPPRALGPQTVFAQADRIVAVGDLHGDLAATRKVLRLAGVMDERDGWTGKTTVLVQTGDQLDRGDHDKEIVDLFERLSREAAGQGGRVVSLNGNHEILNVMGYHRYVTRGGFRAFETVSGLSLQADAVRAIPRIRRARAAAFIPGGPYARLLAARPVVAKVGSSVFVHGGLLARHIDYGLLRINAETSGWMRGERPIPPILKGRRSPVWLRLYSKNPDAAACAHLEAVLKRIGSVRMVVGHTPQQEINSACGNKVWRIDVGLSRFYGGRPQALEITADRVRVLVSPKGSIQHKRRKKSAKQAK